jgi:hypothetical protein
LIDNVTLPRSLSSELVVNTQSVTCGGALPAVSVSFKAHEDNSLVSNCTVNLGESEQTSATTTINISGIRTDPDRSITQTVTAGSGGTLWTIVFEVLWEQTVTICGQTVYENGSAGFATAALANADAGVSGQSLYNIAPSTTFKQVATVKSDANGNLGVFNTLLINASAANLATCSANTRASPIQNSYF